MNKKNNTNVKILVFRIFSTLIILIALYFIFHWYQENQKSKELLAKISSTISFDPINNEEYKSDEYSSLYASNFNQLLLQNPNTVAWLKVNNTEINHPVVNYTDNDFYLNHSFDNSYNSAGWIFSDYRNAFDGTDKNIIIYGHNRRNGSMFSSLKKVINKKWYSNTENHILTLYTTSEKISYKVFSVYTIKAETYYTSTNFKNENEYNNFLSTLKNRSIYDFNENINDSDTIITLSTCANDNSYRVVLHAKRIDK